MNEKTRLGQAADFIMGLSLFWAFWGVVFGAFVIFGGGDRTGVVLVLLGFVLPTAVGVVASLLIKGIDAAARDQT